ncbi:MAG: FG-GAP-like repeat-containing protein [Opitutus sp.]
MFTTLSPAQTGISGVNSYDDPAMWGARYREFSLGAIGSGVAIADYDGDGRPDIFAVTKTGPNRLFRNLDELKFEDVSSRAGVGGSSGPWQQGAAFADVDNDGRPDIYVCRFGAPNLLYMNLGDGTFREEAEKRGLALVDASSMAAFADFDRDGWLDVYIQTNLLDGEKRPNGQRDRLFRNQGDGTFLEVTEKAGIRGECQGHSATWWDYNEDGWPDLYVANDFKDPDVLYRNNRDGTFTNVLSNVVPHTPHSSMGADLADVNNDGHIDLLVADMAATSRESDQRGMARLRVGLTENQQRPDAAPQYMRNALYLNTGSGVMLEAAFLAGLQATDWTWSVRFEDLDNDGKVDAYFTNGMLRELHNADLVSRMTQKESLADRIRIMKASQPFAQRHLVYQNLGDLRFVEKGAAWGLDHVGVGLGAALGDLDGDGDLDLVFSSMDGELTVCRNDVASGHSVVFALLGRSSNRYGVGATVRIETDEGAQVRSLVLARGYLSTSEPVLHFGLGTTQKIKRVTVDWPSGRRSVAENLAVDRRYTLTEPDDAALGASATMRPQFSEVTERANLNGRIPPSSVGELKQQALLPLRLDQAGPPLLVATLDGDGEDDLVIGGVSGTGGQLFSNLGKGQFLAYGGSTFVENTATADGPMVTLDVDADGDLDLLVTKAGIAAVAGSGAYQPRLFINDGTGRFKPAPTSMLPEFSSSVGAAAAADFDHSGRLGVFLGARVVPGQYPENPRSALWLWREDKFMDVLDEWAPDLRSRGMVTAALWSDVDADGWMDLLVCFDWGEVACYRNVNGQRLEDVSERLGFKTGGSGWWRSIATADFNHDGRPDYVVGNVGLNTPYHGTRDKPTMLYAHVSLDGSAPQLVEAQAEGDRWFPLRTRETLGKVFPSLMRRFPSTDAYAKAGLTDTFPADVLNRATKYEATELQSGLFLSKPDGTYEFAPLPRMAQIAPINGICAGDFDGDGDADIVCVGNSYSPIPEVGRFDGGVGWLLRGDGQGHFSPALAAESGFIVRHDARALGVIDLNQDGWPDLVATRNNDRPVALLNHSPANDRHSFGVTLRGRPGNPSAIGSRLALVCADGTRQIQEIAAGAGYFSQSTASIFFGFKDSNPPRELRIHGPDGHESVQTFSSLPPKVLRVSHP